MTTGTGPRAPTGSYSTGVDGGAPVSMQFAISGRIDVPDYVVFIAERARWLDIAGSVVPNGSGVTLVASGPEALVGALEMAALLGPLSALPEIVGVEIAPVPVAPGFEIRT